MPTRLHFGTLFLLRPRRSIGRVWGWLGYIDSLCVYNYTTCACLHHFGIVIINHMIMIGSTPSIYVHNSKQNILHYDSYTQVLFLSQPILFILFTTYVEYYSSLSSTSLSWGIMNIVVEAVRWTSVWVGAASVYIGGRVTLIGLTLPHLSLFLEHFNTQSCRIKARSAHTPQEKPTTPWSIVMG